MQHDPKYILPMYDVFQKYKCDLVIGARQLIKGRNQGLSESRRFASNILIFFFFLFKKEIYTRNKINFFGQGFKILADFLINSKNDLRIKDFYIIFKRRYDVKSKMNFKIVLILI